MNRRTISKKITKQNKMKSEDIKVVYISSPVKVKTCASKFKNLVQELTGRHSDLSRFVEANNSLSPVSTDVDDHKQYLSVVDLVAGAGDDIDSSTSPASSESNYNYQLDEESRPVNCFHLNQSSADGLSLFETSYSQFDVDRFGNYCYIPTF
ncbi:sigma factor binding protein 2, chloroplastic-like [Impatiens glandulifera]|uniref:sigma factor binding protein 2, chloroplastic-like n=1 Tax=Impatiens glandulifera TaxID=253017 RepID=UPI001FB157F0|nr:sigma factor binding protein 2, chloroplastic-like [Impatiens glandulifera]